MLRLCVLGSGSRGNSIYLGDGETDILIDAGLSAKQTGLRLQKIGVALNSIDAIVVSHEHTDHISGIPVLTKRNNILCYTNRLTAEEMANGRPAPNLKVFSTGEVFKIGYFEIHPFTVPHDAVDPVGFEITNGERKICVATDLGHATTLVRHMLKDADCLVLEANHDENMLMSDIRRPLSLKQRIRSKIGHLSNRDSGKLIAEVAGNRLRNVLLAHISVDCNTPAIAEETVRQYLAESGANAAISLTYQDEVAQPVTLA
jgi:phosphoribosyl 1,2-cyclic phosphodiesterase